MQQQPKRRAGYDETADYIGIKKTTLRALVCRGRVPHIRLGGRLVVFDLDAIDEYLAANTVGGKVG